MTTLRTAAQQALEALEIMQPEVQMGEGDAAIKALRTALAEEALHIDTLRMAREAGFAVEDGGVYTPDAYGPGDVTQLVKRFADLVSAAERERFADECIDIVARWGGSVEIEAAIRARSNNGQS